jgi:biopolymer transport protein ExbB/TolQ
MYDLTSSDLVYYILIVLLIVISLAMLYLMYTQNKELSDQIKAKTKKQTKRNNHKPTVSSYQQVDSLDGREELLEVSRMTIPKHLEYTQTLFSNSELQELQGISKEIEENYKERQNDIDTYEEEQEESAIISYDELVNKKQNDNKVVEESNVNIETDEDYRHEEDFLSKLKNLNNDLK